MFDEFPQAVKPGLYFIGGLVFIMAVGLVVVVIGLIMGKFH